jgi:hypothetical protein
MMKTLGGSFPKEGAIDSATREAVVSGDHGQVLGTVAPNGPRGGRLGLLSGTSQSAPLANQGTLF